MGYDGELKFDTKIDKTGFKVGIGELGSIAQSGMQAVTTAVTAAGTALTALGGYAVSVGKDFESSMSQVIATMGITKDSIVDGVNSYDLLKEAAAKAGAETVFSASEAADALNYLALAGYSAVQAADALPAVLNLAAAGGLDLAYASDLATDAMAALGIEANSENLTRFGDELAKTASTANANVAQLGEAILTVGGTAKSLAGGTTELNAALGVLANRGIKGSEGGTALRNMILALTAPTDKAAQSIENLGLAVYDAEGNMRPLNEIFKDLDASLSGMSEGEKTAVLNEIFNKVDLKSAQAMLAGCGEEFDNLTAALEGCDGAMAQMAETMNDNLQGDLKSIQSRAEAFGIAIYEGIQEPLRNVVQLGIDYISQLTDAYSSGGFDGLASALGDVLGDAISRVAEFAPRFFELGANIIDSLISGLIRNKSSIVDAARTVITGLIQSFAELYPAIISAGIEMITQLAVGMTENAEELGEAIGDGIQLIVDTVANNAPTFIKAAVSVIKSFVSGITQNLDKLLNAAFSIINTLCSELLTSENIAAITSAAIKIVFTLAQAILENAGELVIAVATGIAEAFDGLSSVFFDFKTEADILAEQEQILGDHIDDNIQRFRDLKDKANQVAAEDLVDLSHVQDLYDELRNLADASGNVKDKDADRVNYILGELSEATGIEMDLIDGQIQKYDELCKSIENVINQKRAEIFLSAYEDAYKEALTNKDTVESELIDQYAAYNEIKAKRDEMKEKAKVLGVENGDIMAYVSTAGGWMKQNGIDWEEYQRLTELQGEQRANIIENEQLYASYCDTIYDYENALTANANKNYDEVVKIFDAEGKAFKTANDLIDKNADEQRQILAQQVEDAKSHAEFMLKQYQNGVSGISASMVEDAYKQISAAKDAYMDGGFTLSQALADGVLEGKSVIDAAIEQVTSAANNAVSAAVTATQSMFGGITLFKGKIPMMAKGGILREGSAIVAEAGPELISVTSDGVKVTPLTDNAQNTALNTFDRIADTVRDFSFVPRSDTGNIINNSTDDHSTGDTTINEENHYHIYTQAKNASDMREIAEGIEFVKSQDRNGKGLKR